MKNQKNIRINEEADKAIDRMVEEVNNGFDGGSVNRTELLTLIVLRFEKHLFRKSIPLIRKVHFDQVVYLESVVRRMKLAKTQGEPVPELGKLLEQANAKTERKNRKGETNVQTTNQGTP